MILMMETTTLYNDIESVVNLRKGMAMILKEGIKRASEGDTGYLKRALNRISTYKGYEVTLNCKERFKIFGHVYGGGKDKTILIKESGKCLFVIYKDRENGKTCLNFSPLDLITKSE